MLVRENGVHSLVIEPVTSRDAGLYTCIASNRAGQNSFNLELIVAGILTYLFIYFCQASWMINENRREHFNAKCS